MAFIYFHNIFDGIKKLYSYAKFKGIYHGLDSVYLGVVIK